MTRPTTPHPAVDPDEVLLTSPQVRNFFGDASDMWIVRRLADDSGFPKPVNIGGRNFWKLGELRAWRDAQFRKHTKRPTRPPIRNKK